MDMVSEAETPTLKPSASTMLTPRKDSKEKDNPGKSSTDPALSAIAPIPISTPTTDTPLLVRLLPFGIAIQQPSDKLAPIAGGSGKTATAADIQADEAGGPASADPKSATPPADLAFALRLTNADATPGPSTPSPAPAPQASNNPQSESSAANVNRVQPGASIQPAKSGGDQSSEQTGQQSDNRSAGQTAQPNGNQPTAPETNRNSKQQHDDETSGNAKGDPAVAAPTAHAAAASPAPAPVTSAAPAPPISQAPVKDAPPVAHTAPAEPIDKPVTSAPAQRISLSVSDSQNQRVDVHLIERAGEVRVSVHAADETLTHSMRADLGSLSGKLAQSGYSTESFAPTGAEGSGFSNQRQPSEGRESAAGDRQNPQQNHSGGQQQPSRDGRGQRPAWVDELENSLASNAAIRSNTPWRQA